MKVSKLKQREGNPRKISTAAIEKIMESIKRDPGFMKIRPIVTDTDGTVIGGNQRLKAIQRLKMKDIPDDWVVRADMLSSEQKKRFVVVDNAPFGMSGEWDTEILGEQYDVPTLRDLGFDTDLMGLSIPSFEPGDEDDQGKLDELEPKIRTCPECGLTFDLREHEQG